MKTITFCGHRSLAGTNTKVLKKQLYLLLKSMILEGATEFLLGGYGEFDILCAETVKELKEEFPHITSVLVIPYIGRDYNKELYDFSEYPPIEKVPKQYAILKRNEYMVQKADVVIAFVKYGFGGAAKTLEYAKRKKKNIINFFSILGSDHKMLKKSCQTVE